MIRRVVNMNMEGYRKRTKKRWLDCMKDDIIMCKKELNVDMTVDKHK